MASPFRPPTPRESRRDRTRAALFDAALAEFRREGFDAASVSEIARRAGVSRPTFYFHFPTKEHVLLELQWSHELRIVERLRGERSLAGALHAFVEGLSEAERDIGDGELFRDMLRIYARRPEGIVLEAQPFPLLFELGRHFAESAGRGELRTGVDPAQATHLFLTGVFGYLMGAPASPEQRRSDLRALVDLYLEERPV